MVGKSVIRIVILPPYIHLIIQKEENDWWYHVQSVICFGQIHIIDNEDERMQRLQQFGEKYFPDNYDIHKELKQNGPHAAILDFCIEHVTGKRVKEN